MSHLTIDTEDIDILIDRLTTLATQLTMERPRLAMEGSAIRSAKRGIQSRLARVHRILNRDNPVEPHGSKIVPLPSCRDHGDNPEPSDS